MFRARETGQDGDLRPGPEAGANAAAGANAGASTDASPEAGADAGVLTPSTHRPLVARPIPLLGFFTRLPLGGAAGIDEVAAAFPLVPLVGYVTGGIAAAFALLVGPILPSPALAALLLALVVGLTGFNQMDGLLDLGDGLMVHGGPGRRLEAMHDRYTGVGAVAAVLFTYLAAFAGLVALSATLPVPGGSGAWFTAASRNLALGIVAAEVLCRAPYLVLAWKGRSSHEGLGAPFLQGFGFRHLAVGALVCAPVAAAGLWLGWLPLVLATLAVLVVAAMLLRTANRLLGGVGGDVMGASQELARAAALVSLAAGQVLALRLGW
jgi:adenosylcobinamide-GDP ribazoletransferase